MGRHTDPVTGDTVSLSEFATIKAQGFIRRWTVFFVFVAGTIVCWIVGGAGVLLWWNLCASAFAVVVELTIGMAQFSQTRRDAAILRNQNEIINEVHELVTGLQKSADHDLQHSKDDLAIDLDSNQVLYDIQAKLAKIEKQLGVK